MEFTFDKFNKAIDEYFSKKDNNIELDGIVDLLMQSGNVAFVKTAPSEYHPMRIYNSDQKN